MARKKDKRKPASLSEVLGVNDILHNEFLNFIIGFLLLALAIYMILSFISYFATGAADQSLIEAPRAGEIMNNDREFQNSCGSIGAYVAHFFINRCFGLAAFMIPVFLVMAALKLIRAYQINLSKWFIGSMLLMIWMSVTFAKFLSPLFVTQCYNPGGDHGAFLCITTENLIGSPGLTAILIVIAIGFLTFVSAETIYLVRKMLNPVKFFTDKVKFNVTNYDVQETDKSHDTVINTLEDPSVFDDPQTEVIEFDTTSEKVCDEPEVSKNDTESTNAKNVNDEVGMDIKLADNEKKADGKSLVSIVNNTLAPYDPKRDLENYHYPTLDLLKKYEHDGKPYIVMAEQTAN